MLTYAQKEAQTMILANPRLILYSSAAANSALEFVLALQVAPLPFLLLIKKTFFPAYIVVVKLEADRRKLGATRVRARAASTAAPPPHSHLFYHHCFLLLRLTTDFHY